MCTSLGQVYDYWQECTCRGQEVSGLKILSSSVDTQDDEKIIASSDRRETG